MITKEEHQHRLSEEEWRKLPGTIYTPPSEQREEKNEKGEER